MKPKSAKVIAPKPFFRVEFGCSNRAFYNVKNELFAIAEKIGIEIQDGYIDEACDYEGDLDKITIYAGERGDPLIHAVCAFYEVPIVAVPVDMNLVLEI